MLELTFAYEATDEAPCWPADGDTSSILFKVIDEEYYLLYANAEFSAVFDEVPFEYLVHEENLPIASGVYQMVVKFWYNVGDSGFFPEWEPDFGLTSLAIRRVGNEDYYE